MIYIGNLLKTDRSPALMFAACLRVGRAEPSSGRARSAAVIVVCVERMFERDRMQQEYLGKRQRIRSKWAQPGSPKKVELQ